VAAVAELPRIGQHRTTLVSISSLRYLHRLVLLTLVISLASLILLLLRLP
jgi:hypothetical protein